MKAAVIASIAASGLAASSPYQMSMSPYQMTPQQGASGMGAYGSMGAMGGMGAVSGMGAYGAMGAMGGAYGQSSPYGQSPYGQSAYGAMGAMGTMGAMGASQAGAGQTRSLSLGGSASVQGQGLSGALSGMYSQQGYGSQYGSSSSSSPYGSYSSQTRSAPMSSAPGLSGYSLTNALQQNSNNGGANIGSMFQQLGSSMGSLSSQYGQMSQGSQWQGLQSGSGITGPGVFGGGSAMDMSSRLQQAQSGQVTGLSGITGYNSALNSYGQNAGYQQAPSYSF